MIELKPEFQSQGFKIGHSNCESETFIPTIFVDPDEFNDIVWVDVAGLDDTGGNLISLINLLLLKRVLQVAKEVKIIIPFTQGLVEDLRGKLIANLVNDL